MQTALYHDLRTTGRARIARAADGTHRVYFKFDRAQGVGLEISLSPDQLTVLRQLARLAKEFIEVNAGLNGSVHVAERPAENNHPANGASREPALGPVTAAAKPARHFAFSENPDGSMKGPAGAPKEQPGHAAKRKILAEIEEGQKALTAARRKRRRPTAKAMKKAR